MDKTIDIKKILEERQVNKPQLAVLLFPKVKFPCRAFSRILTGEAELSASQIATLAEFLNMSVDELYGNKPNNWTLSDVRDNNIVFIQGHNFRAEIDTQSWSTKLYYKDELITQDVICDGQIPIGEYLKKLDNLITDYIELA